MKLRFEVEFTQRAVYVRSPDVLGLIVSGKSLDDALRQVPGAIASLLLAAAFENAQGRECEPVIQPVTATPST